MSVMKTWESNELFASDPTVLEIDRRQQVRSAPVTSGTHLWVEAGRRIAVQIVDESANGIGIEMPDIPFEFGPLVYVDYQGKRRAAMVAYLNRDVDGSHRLGLEWA